MAPDHVDPSDDTRGRTKYIRLDLLQGMHHKTPKHDEQEHEIPGKLIKDSSRCGWIVLQQMWKALSVI